MNISSDEDQQKKERNRSCIDEEESEKRNAKNIKIFTKKEIIKIISEAKDNDLHSTSRKYNIDRKHSK